jgi:hypothetical protein
MEHFDDNVAGGRQSLAGIQQHPSTMEAGGGHDAELAVPGVLAAAAGARG